MTKPDRPKTDPGPRWYVVTLKDGTRLLGEANNRAEARHYSKSWREGFRSSIGHYLDVASVRLARGAPF